MRDLTPSLREMPQRHARAPHEITAAGTRIAFSSEMAPALVAAAVALGLAFQMQPVLAWGEAEPDSSLDSDPRRVALEETRDPDAAKRRRNSLITRPDRRRVRPPIEISVFDRPLRLSGRVTLDNEVEIDRLRRFDVTRRIDGSDPDPGRERGRGRRPLDDQIHLDQRIELDLFYAFTDNVALYIEGQVEWENLVYSDFEKEKQRSKISRKEAWLYVGGFFDTAWGAQIGAQRFSDNREWWWDEDLDAFRIRYDGAALAASIAVAQQLLPGDDSDNRIDPEQDEILRFFADASWSYAADHSASLRLLHQHDASDNYRLGACTLTTPGGAPLDPFFLPDAQLGCVAPKQEDESDAQLTWFGGSLEGKFRIPVLGKLNYWLDAAGVAGEETVYDFAGPGGPGEGRRAETRDRSRVLGFGADLGLFWETNLPGHPTLIAGYAFGSGRDGDTTERQRGFRQTGLQGNSDRFRGVATFKYYGELFDPELSNLEIWTFGVGIPLLRESSLDFLYHRYRQVETVEFFRDVGLRRRPFGANRDVGDEFDVILGIEEWERFEIKAVFAVFLPGRAFAPGENVESYLGSLRFRLNF